MSVIQSIRTKYAKLAGFVIALALVGFILMDAASGGLKDLFGNDTSVATVNGEEIDYVDYQQRVQEYEILYAYGRQGQPLDDATRAQINEQALEEMIKQNIIRDQAEEIGLQSTENEERDMIYGANPDPNVRNFQYFVDPETGMFDPQRIRAFEQQANQIDPTGNLMKQWETIKTYITRNNLERKFNALITSAAYVPSFIIERQLKDQSTFASIDYVKVPFTSIPDNEVKVTDEDLKAYMKERKDQYTIEAPTRSIAYVSFDVAPSAEDSASTQTTISNLKENFQSTDDVESFINRNSDEPYNPQYVTKKSFMSMYSDSIMNLNTGQVYGPYIENGAYKLTKVLEKATLPDSVRLRHILVKTEDRRQPVAADSTAKNKIDSVADAIKAGADFNAMVQQYSDDEGSRNTAGEYTFDISQRAGISKEFGDFVFEGRTGEKKVVKVENDAYAGYHYIEILEQKGSVQTAKIASVSKALYPSEETEQTAFANASEFAGNYNTEKTFDEGVKKLNLNKRIAENIRPNSFVLPGIGSSRDIIRWVYDHEVGSVSPVFSLNGRYIVVKVTGKKEPGLMAIDESNRPSLEAAVMAEKKAEKIKEKYKTPASLQSLAQTVNSPIASADSFNLAGAFLPNLGYEPKVVGYSFYDGLKPNAVSPGISGQDGVFYISKKNNWAVPVQKMEGQAMQNEKISRMVQLKNSLATYLQEVLRKNADVEYNTEML